MRDREILSTLTPEEKALNLRMQYESGSTTPNAGQGFSSKGYNPQPGERTLDGYVRNNANMKYPPLNCGGW